jgi:hypothetical protein
MTQERGRSSAAAILSKVSISSAGARSETGTDKDPSGMAISI